MTKKTKKSTARILNSNGENVTDIDLLRLALPNVPGLDKIFDGCGGLTDLITADPLRLSGFGATRETIVAMKALHDIVVRFGRQRIQKRNVVSSWRDVLDYCNVRLAHADIEKLAVLFLNNQNMLIADEILWQGTVDHTPLYPREVVRRALLHNASAIIMVHNHPSGDCTPSRQDKIETKNVRDACKVLNIELHDHVVVTPQCYYSFKSHGLL